MRILATVALLALCASTAFGARVSQIVAKDVKMQLQRPTGAVQPLERAADQSLPNPQSSKLPATLNCENDNILNPFNTLVLDAGDLAGTIFDVPAEPNPYLVAEVALGLYDFNSSYPAQIDLILFESNAAGTSFDSIAGFTVDLDTALDPDGEILVIDIREFQITGENDLLVMYGDAGGANEALLLPAGDDSPRCATAAADNVCSVHLPAGGSSLFIYGVVDTAGCPRTTHHILNLDLVTEVLLEDIVVSTTQSSIGAVKARF